MSALPPKADIGTQPCDVRFVPKADIAIRLPSRFGTYDFDLDEDLGPDELWDDKQHRIRTRLFVLWQIDDQSGLNAVQGEIFHSYSHLAGSHRPSG